MSFTLRVDLGTACDSHVPHSHFIYQEISEEIVLLRWYNIPWVHVLNDPVCSLDACGAGANSPGHWGVGVVLLIISVRNGDYHLKPFQQGRRLFDCGSKKYLQYYLSVAPWWLMCVWKSCCCIMRIPKVTMNARTNRAKVTARNFSRLALPENEAEAREKERLLRLLSRSAPTRGGEESLPCGSEVFIIPK